MRKRGEKHPMKKKNVEKYLRKREVVKKTVEKCEVRFLRVLARRD